jgi:hypothetical protein
VTRHRIALEEVGGGEAKTFRVNCRLHGHVGDEYPDSSSAFAEVRQGHVWGHRTRLADGTWIDTPAKKSAKKS